MSKVKGIQEIVLHEKMKSDCYRFLSACFCQPQNTLFQAENLLNNLSMNLRQTSPEAALFSALMEKHIRQYSDDDLTIEYARLFLGPFEIKAPPYGSLYLDGEKKVMGDSTMEVIRFYEEAGLSGSKDYRDLPDHIAVELEFMSYLIYRETEALEKLDFVTALATIEKQEDFLDRFLGPWIAPLCGKIKESTDNDFYAALADCAFTFIRSAHPGPVREAIRGCMVDKA
ncbi:MAG: TorD/DmsD family molecular chaperone [Syntrophales bacterium]